MTRLPLLLRVLYATTRLPPSRPKLRSCQTPTRGRGPRRRPAADRDVVERLPAPPARARAPDQPVVPPRHETGVPVRARAPRVRRVRPARVQRRLQVHVTDVARGQAAVPSVARQPLRARQEVRVTRVRTRRRVVRAVRQQPLHRRRALALPAVQPRGHSSHATGPRVTEQFRWVGGVPWLT